MANSNLPWQQCFLFTPAGSGRHKTLKLAKVSLEVESDLLTCVDQNMKVAAALALLLLNVRLSRACFGEGHILFCRNIPTAFMPGYSSVVMILKDVGEINSTVLHSDDLTTVTRLRIENAGVTGIAERAFNSFQSLTNLNLNQNLLTEMNPRWFGRPDILSELSLTGNHFKVLSEFMLTGLISLTRLNLSNNGITTIDPNSFSSQTALAELDLSKNRMTQMSRQVFRSLKSTRIRLDGNPWDCSCGAEDFVDFLKDLESRSLLNRSEEVTCESPPSLRGRPVWNVVVCVTSPPTRPPSVTQTIQPRPTVVTTPPSRPTLETKTSVQTKPTDCLTTTTPTATPILKTESYPSVTRISVRPKPSDLPLRTLSTSTGMSETSVTSQPSSDTNTVCTLVVVIVILFLLLFVVCFLVLLRWRKHSNKTVMPGDEESSRASHTQSLEHPEKRDHWDAEVGQRRSFAGVRAKSANAILTTSPFCAPVKEQVTLHTETEAQSKETENQTEGKQTVRSECEGDERVEKENITDMTDVREAAGGRNVDKTVITDAVPYLSIGTTQNKPGYLNKQATDGSGQRSQMRKAMGRISTWPPTAIQWQARRKMIEEEEEEEEVSVWTPGEMKKVSSKVEHHSETDQDKHTEEIEKNPTENPLNTNDTQTGESPKPSDKTSISEAHAHTDMRQEREVMIQDPASVSLTTNETTSLNQEKLSQTPELKSAGKSSNNSEQRNEAKPAVTGRQRAENRSTGSKGPSGGASPDDETLLSGNEYAFMDLLHEVVQNNGRWTRERWRQTHVNKQRR